MEFKKLIEDSFSMLYGSVQRPNLNMLYNASMDTFSEGFIWNGWWIQNSYGFTLGAVPFLGGLWRDVLQRSYDLFWDRIGDGKRIGADEGKPCQPECLDICAPDGSLGDCVLPNGIVYKQGDGDYNSYEWFYEATAAGVVMECEMLLFGRNKEKIEKYIPLMRRSLDFIEKTRDSNGLFLVGRCCNLLAPSYGGSPDGGKAYLTGLSVTYAAALERFIEVLKLAGEDFSEYVSRLEKTKNSLPQMLTDKGYYCKSMDKDGTKHGVYGSEKYGYFETLPNIDAIALGIADESLSNSIYGKLSSVENLRKYGIICANYPHLDDTCVNYRNADSAPDSLGFKSGDWVDGGCWATVEGRAILAYMRLGKYEDAFIAAKTYMDWTDEYRQDSPFSQWGANTHNPWAKEFAPNDYDNCRPVAVVVDNFAPATCLLRGLFGYEATSDGLVLVPSIPPEIGNYYQKYPVYFGKTKVYIAYESGNAEFKAYIGSEEIEVIGNRIFIPEELLCGKNEVTITLSKSGNGPIHITPHEETLSGDVTDLPDDLMKIYVEAKDLYCKTNDEKYFRICKACESATQRRQLPYIEHGLRQMTENKKAAIVELYDNAVRSLWRGLAL
ncbi:MAG: hypothetical protein E7481_04940 [Ruminococcaceae bacterium]|nr:hypothetical protein [Oscillospiraceae bacterium]